MSDIDRLMYQHGCAHQTPAEQPAADNSGVADQLRSPWRDSMSRIFDIIQEMDGLVTQLEGLEQEYHGTTPAEPLNVDGKKED